MEYGPDSPEDQKTRQTLLKYYSSECMTHGSHIVAIAIGLFAFVEIIVKGLLGEPAICFIVSTFFTVSVYTVARIVLWGTLASDSLHVRPWSYENTAQKLSSKLPFRSLNEEGESVTFLLRLHYACFDKWAKNHIFWNSFAGEKFQGKLYLVLFITVFVLLFVYYDVITSLLFIQ